MADNVLDLEKKVTAKNARMRLDAGLVYMTDQSGITLDQLANDERFNVSKRTLERWCKEDRWVERRQEFLENWAAVARGRLGSELCRLRQGELAQLEEIQQLAMEKVRSELTVTKSWEGVVKVLLDTNRRVEALAASIGAEIMPGQATARFGGNSEGGEQLSETEKQSLAKQLLQMRRDAIRRDGGQPVIEAEATPSTD
jgi:hypothetical protein